MQRKRSPCPRSDPAAIADAPHSSEEVEDGGAAPFWESKALAEMTQEEWERICDGCGRCCLLKVEDEDTGEIYLTRLTCRLLDRATCKCGDYPNRRARVPDCLSLTPEMVSGLDWLPESCGYRRIEEGRGLAWWHPLISGDPETVHQAGISVRAYGLNETAARLRRIETYLMDAWPVNEPEDSIATRPGRKKRRGGPR